MEVGIVKKIDIDAEMRESYLSYAMSVIVSRALPDARDGLKPVQRRILYAMHDMGLFAERSYKKSARVVGEVLGKYHPHGDQSVYDAMVRMAQDFSMRYELVDGQGNFGSIDGDAAAAMRYTEARMAEFGQDMLVDIGKATVDFTPNFDDSLSEPAVLPSIIPNLLVNGSSGIAVGMSTSIPPHNLTEVIQALQYMLDKWESYEDITPSDLMEFVQGPDFPTGGVIFRYRENKKAESGRMDALANAYATGKGRITVRAKVHVEQMERNKNRIVITELPYQTNKTNLLSRIADLHRDGRIEGLTDLRDETDRNGIRIVLETTRTVEVEDVLADLYKHTPLQSTFSINMLALVDGEPRVLTLKQALRVYIEHRLEIVRRRSEYDLARAEERAHILEGLLVALDNLDEVIDAIRRSRTTDTARNNLIKRFKLSEIQAQAILDMPLRRLAALEQRKIQDEHKEKQKLIKDLNSLLVSPKQMRDVVKEELFEVLEKYGDRRQSRIVDLLDSDVSVPSDLIPDEQVWVLVGEKGTIGRTTARNATSISGKMDEMPLALMRANTQDFLYLFAADGQAVCLPVHQLPQISQYGEGVHWAELTALTRRQHVVATLVVPMDTVGYLTMASLAGVVKRVRLDDVPLSGGDIFTVMRIEKGDSLGWAKLTNGQQEIVLATANGQAIRFSEDDVRPMGLPAGGVMGIKLKGDTDGVVAMEIAVPDGYLWTVTDDGLAKATLMSEYPVQGRHGQGVVNLKLPKESVEVVTAVVGAEDMPLYLKLATGSVRNLVLGKSKIGSRSIKPAAVVKVGPRSRIVGVVGLTERPENLMEDPESETAQQLSLIG
ncbi:MAG: DNA gyrase subunit A [Anaerolineales bacterium]|nr:DNA gyrase subunit A [Anaerolineales bacterium]